MPKKIRVYELARELGMTNKECLDLCDLLGIGAKSHSSSIVDAQADRVRRKAEREGLIREVPDEQLEPDPEPKPKPKPKPKPRSAVKAAEPAEPPAPVAQAPAPVAAESGQPDAPKPSRVVTSSGSSGPTPTPPLVRPAPAEGAPAGAQPEPRRTDDPGTRPEPVAKTDPNLAPKGSSGKPIPPPPPPRSVSGKPIPPPPGQGPRRAAPAGRGRPGGGSGAARPGSSPTGGAARPGGAPGGGGRPGGGRPGGPQRQQRRRKGRRRRRNREELQPMEVASFTPENAPVPTDVVVVERATTPQDLGPKLNRTTADVVRFLMQQGEMVTATQSLSDDMIELFAADIGAEVRLVNPGEEQEVELKKMLGIEPSDTDTDSAADEDMGPIRPPVITIMGHVDHGKTKLLDRIRSANVVDDEAGGITQHIGAYQTTHNEHVLTFIDTPGHEAFTAMRARGASATDIVVLVVAADDGVMPQTEEAINHARAADVPIVVAINKIDREAADPQRVLSQLAERNLVPESWGGDTITVEVSALEGLGVDDLLEQLVLVSEIEELRAVNDGQAQGVVLESQLDIGRGPVATLLVKQGTLKVGDPVVAGAAWGRVRALIDDSGNNLKEAPPSTPVQVLGLSEVAEAGDEFVVAPSEKVASRVADTREHWQRQASIGRESASPITSGAKLEDIFSQIQAGQAATLNLIVKADVNGSLEAVTDSLNKLGRDEVRLAFVHRGVGGVTENDVQLAAASNATIIGFNVRPDRKAREAADQEQVEIRTYEIIYKLLEDIEDAIIGMLAPEFEEIVTGECEVREIFRVPRIGAIAGCYVTNGVITRGSKVRFLRDGTVIWNGAINSLRRFKDDAREVQQGFECGIGLSDFQDLKQGDVIETYEEREIARS